MSTKARLAEIEATIRTGVYPELIDLAWLCSLVDPDRIAVLLDVVEAAQHWAETLRFGVCDTKEKAATAARRNFQARDALLDALDLLPQQFPKEEDT